MDAKTVNYTRQPNRNLFCLYIIDTLCNALQHMLQAETHKEGSLKDIILNNAECSQPKYIKPKYFMCRYLRHKSMLNDILLQYMNTVE